MKRIGETIRTAQGKLVLRSPDDSYPDLGTAVVDENLDDVGTVVSIFGPVDRPYVAVVPDGQPDPRLIGSPLYARD